MIVAEVMTQAVRTCAATDSLSAAAQIMWELDCGAVPVVRDDGHVMGMITDRDICMAAHLRGQRLGECLVRDAMGAPAISVRPSDAIEKAESVMREHRIRRVPVIDESDRVTGIVSLNDLVLAVQRTDNQRGRRPEALVSTLTAICQHRQTNARAAAA
jgi:CBS-domain-containing membrane protein